MKARKTAKKVATKRPAKKRVAVAGKTRVTLVHSSAYVKRPSNVTKKPPTKRLQKRRATNTEKGYFPNPRREWKYAVTQNGDAVFLAKNESDALTIANMLQANAAKDVFFRAKKV